MRPRNRHTGTIKGPSDFEELLKLVSPSLLQASFSFLGEDVGSTEALPGPAPGLALSPFRISPPPRPSQRGRGGWAVSFHGWCDQRDKVGIQTLCPEQWEICRQRASWVLGWDRCRERGTVRGRGANLSRSTSSEVSCSCFFNFSTSPKVGGNQGALSAQWYGGPDTA